MQHCQPKFESTVKLYVCVYILINARETESNTCFHNSRWQELSQVENNPEFL